ncbi:bifunctional phosphopantothenoylcysteine decarboxylase/phosphopantothenate synthase [Erythrobacter sp. SCSIO 43205]|uniref:bifunctional phosphopantothenoylcysteine decarboxylase/phosphopantothenate synthase n=1 Tax=Erythrobacter sp. SCSIO 43205 TaxID=2779361 RepID=UPI001CA8E4BA|nr:bifunctional phosphopantothenoylcysteine decarboxylase/phosphopantothenate synthase [Erythrobacter sp. SCSIO 43205]UAB78175.1 bifunctional phosphopantothenoylcysteine decarboxylase/phosphopantothenate synthase [Erythrobacter sp. SCSIO 43205]
MGVENLHFEDDGQAVSVKEPKILLVVGGGIAAYKSLELVRLIRKGGGSVTPVVTKGGQQFVTPMSLAALSESQVYTSLFDLKNEVEMGHIELSREADLVVVCPATADLMAKMAAGVADDLATTLLLATNKPVLAVPAMNVKMWEHASTVRNVATLRDNGVHVLHPDEGMMACGEFGYGRLPEPPAIWRAIAEHFGIEVEEEAPAPATTLPPAEVEALEPEDESEAASSGGLSGLLSRIIPRSTEKRSAEEIEAELHALGEAEVPEEFLQELPEEEIEFDPNLAGSPLAKKGAGKAAPPVDQDAINHEVDERRLAPDAAEEGLSDKASDLVEAREDTKVTAKAAAPASMEAIAADEEEIAGIVADAAHQPLAGRHVLVTAGPTWESIDPVRYIANRSSGKQGFAIAAAAAALGANVTLVAGPVFLKTPAGVKRIDVESAEEMSSAVKRALPADVAVMVAAVADWRPKEYRDEKIKKRGSAPPALMLTENPDILTNVAAGTNRPALVVGFAAETDAVIDHAKQKRKRKAADWIVANDVSGDVMGGDNNAVHIITSEGVESLDQMPKGEVAMALVNRMADALAAKG